MFVGISHREEAELKIVALQSKKKKIVLRPSLLEISTTVFVLRKGEARSFQSEKSLALIFILGQQQKQTFLMSPSWSWGAVVPPLPQSTSKMGEGGEGRTPEPPPSHRKRERRRRRKSQRSEIATMNGKKKTTAS